MVITLRSNHSIGLLVARSFTTVGSTRVSMGPAMSVSVRGCAGLPASAITAVATSAATHGWHTAITWVPGPRISIHRIRCSMYPSKSKVPSARGTSRALCQSVTHTSCSGSSVRTVPRRRVAKWPESGATRSTLGSSTASGAVSFRKCSSVPNGVTSVASSSTATCRRPTVTGPMSKGGRSWVSPTRPSSS